MRKLFLSILILVVMALITACNTKDEETESKEEIITPVETEEVITGDFAVDQTMYGNVSPLKQTPVLLEQPGEVRTLKVENGDNVKKDDHIATIKTPMGNKSIYAPTDGVVANLNVQEDAFQSNEEPLMVIVNLEELKATFNVTSATRNKFKKDKKVNIHIEDKKYEAKVLPIDTLPNESGQFVIEAKLDNKDEDILPGMNVKLILSDKRVKDTLIIPTEAIMTEVEESFVFIVSDNKAKKVMVEIKETQSDITAIDADDLNKGDQVVVKGQFTLKDESKVEVVKEGN